MIPFIKNEDALEEKLTGAEAENKVIVVCFTSKDN